MLYLLAVDGSIWHALEEDIPTAEVLPLGWSPDGKQAVFAVWRRTATFPMEIRSWDVDTGVTRRLPGVPNWSPDGEHLSYVLESYGDAWLADGDWQDARPITDRAWAAWQAGTWSPDSTRVALQLDTVGRTESTIAIFDLETEKLETLTTATELSAALTGSKESYIADGTDSLALKERPLRWMRPFDWSTLK